jgi:MoaA/NifB/PqqE/SkfB family radical SAM enzyme
MKINRQELANKFYKNNVNYSIESFQKENMLPHRYVLVLTNLCNLRCSFCFQERKKKPDRMETADWLSFIRQVPENSRITLTGGEPLVFKGFAEIFKFANQKNYTNIVTNGLLLDNKISELLISEKNFKVLGISIDTIGNTNRDFSSKQWNDLVSKINYFLNIRNKNNHECVFDIKTVVLEDNIKDLFDIHKYCCEVLNCDTHSFQLLKGADIQHSDLMFDYDKIFKKYEAYQYKNFSKFIEQLNLIREYNLKNNYKSYLHPNIINLNSSEFIEEKNFLFLNEKEHDHTKFKTCLSPWTSVHVNVDGNLFPCMAVSMGNVKNTSLETIYFSEKFNKFKEEIKRNSTLNGCNRCGWLKV